MSSNLHLVVSLDAQMLSVMQGDRCVAQFAVSTATKGMGFTPGSYRTPTGKFRIVEKIGAGLPSGTIFKGRVPTGIWQSENGEAGDLILTRILRIEGLDDVNTNTFDRLIYLHGTNGEDHIGQPGSHGCIRLGNADIIALFDLVEVGATMEILPATQRRGRLLFIDCDSTLSSIEGIDELARAKGDEVFAQVEALTNAAMNGDVPIHEVFARRLEMISPDRATAEYVANLYVKTLVPGMADFVLEIKAVGWLPVILSGGFAPLIQPLARFLGINHVEAVPMDFHEDGSYASYGSGYPTTRNLGKNEVIREWKQAMLPERVVMMGDGISDLETKPDVDAFIGFGGVVKRPRVMRDCDYWVDSMDDPQLRRQLIDKISQIFKK
jgi:phosphoserine phosphatase